MNIVLQTFLKFSSNKKFLSYDDFMNFYSALKSSVDLKFIDNAEFYLFYYLADCTIDTRHKCTLGISYEIFYAWWEDVARYDYLTGNTHYVLKKAWDIYVYHASIDEHGNYTMSMKKLESVLDSLHVKYDAQSIKNIDANHDSVITFSEFIDWLKWV